VEWVKTSEAAPSKKGSEDEEAEAEVREEGGFEFVRVDVEGHSLEVTPDHALLIGGEHKLKAAGAVWVGDVLPTVSEGLWRANSSVRGRRLSGADVDEVEKVKEKERAKVVERVSRSRRREKVTIATQHGSLVANGVLVSTMCGDSFKDGETFESAVPSWRELHKIAAPSESESGSESGKKQEEKVEKVEKAGKKEKGA
jgi:intein/homing endonuclease